MQLNYADKLLRDEKKSAIFGLREAVFNAPQLVPAGHDIGVMRKIKAQIARLCAVFSQLLKGEKSAVFFISQREPRELGIRNIINCDPLHRLKRQVKFRIIHSRRENDQQRDGQNRKGDFD